jgi:toxin ParE1/3/4
VNRLRWTVAAGADLDHIYDDLAAHRPHLIDQTIREIHNKINALQTSPHRGRPGRIEGTRELVFSWLPYIVVYRVKADTIEILHIYHGSQDRPVE